MVALKFNSPSLSVDWLWMLENSLESSLRIGNSIQGLNFRLWSSLMVPIDAIRKRRLSGHSKFESQWCYQSGSHTLLRSLYSMENVCTLRFTNWTAYWESLVLSCLPEQSQDAYSTWHIELPRTSWQEAPSERYTLRFKSSGIGISQYVPGTLCSSHHLQLNCIVPAFDEESLLKVCQLESFPVTSSL